MTPNDPVHLLYLAIDGESAIRRSRQTACGESFAPDRLTTLRREDITCPACLDAGGVVVEVEQVAETVTRESMVPRALPGRAMRFDGH